MRKQITTMKNLNSTKNTNQIIITNMNLIVIVKNVVIIKNILIIIMENTIQMNQKLNRIIRFLTILILIPTKSFDTENDLKTCLKST